MRAAGPCAVILTVLLVAGCSAEAPTPPVAADVYASQEEAAADAESTFAAFIAASDAVLADGGTEPQRTHEYLTETMQDAVDAGVTAYIDSHWHTAGTSAFESFSVVDFVNHGAEGADLTATLCLDLTAVAILDESGAEVTPAGKVERVPLSVDFVAAKDGPLRISSSAQQGDGDACA